MKTMMFCLFAMIAVSRAQQSQPLLTRDAVVRDLFSHTRVSGRPPVSIGEPTDVSDPGAREKKTIALAALYSLLLPGMGEIYAGDDGSGKYFTIAEGALWITLGSVHWYATWLQNDARAFAGQHASVVTENKTDQYFVDIGNFSNTYTYNQGVLRAREYFKTYDPNSNFAWNWDSDASRAQFRDMRIAGDEMFNNTKFIAAAIGLNHLISAVNAGRIALAYNKMIDQAALIDVHAGVMGTLLHPHGVVITLTKHF